MIPPAAFLFASVMVAIGALARSFKEAQTLLTPVYFLCMAPSLLAALGDFELSGVAPFIPGIGVTLLARDVIAGHASVGATVAVFASSVGYGAAALALACRLYDSERLLGSDDAGLPLRAWLRHLIRGPRCGPPEDASAPPTAGEAHRALRLRMAGAARVHPDREVAARARPRPAGMGRPAGPHRRVRARQRASLRGGAAASQAVGGSGRGRAPDRTSAWLAIGPLVPG